MRQVVSVANRGPLGRLSYPVGDVGVDDTMECRGVRRWGLRFQPPINHHGTLHSHIPRRPFMGIGALNAVAPVTTHENRSSLQGQ